MRGRVAVWQGQGAAGGGALLFRSKLLRKLPIALLLQRLRLLLQPLLTLLTLLLLLLPLLQRLCLLLLPLLQRPRLLLQPHLLLRAQAVQLLPLFCLLRTNLVQPLCFRALLLRGALQRCNARVHSLGLLLCELRQR